MVLYSDNIKEVKKVITNKEKDYIKMEIITKDDKKAHFFAEYGKYCDWLSKKKNDYKDPFVDFIGELYAMSLEEEKELSEIIDKYGNIMPDDDKPSNATNKEIGINNVFDTDKIYKQSIPRNYRYYAGDLGIGIITW